jgi:hypothetical protein
MRKQYNFWPGVDGLDAWDVDRLISLSAALPVRKVRLDSLFELDTNYWDVDASTTVRMLSEHLQLIDDADTKYPIILASSGRIMDGMHRVVKLLLSGAETIEAVQFETDPVPDFTNCRPDELNYG